ncbi:hypothetical protein LX16_4087 [Stackebrandtia albiflava]|uniref:Uncharacterized protein n=1 Tax=Stackebrandtia albiflava TaxID=406432 RepID=A0A562UYJ0_9ACTN|nr:hypothetical protein [Stackebrandtia albiflava]TWJ10667.1 hypothetical protein LX16_4087 [Stackebrandtia albiflava]
MTYPPPPGYPGGPPQDPYGQQQPDPYGQQYPPAGAPYGQQPDPYGQQQPDPYGQQQPDPYGQPPQSDPYGQQQPDPYGQQPQYPSPGQGGGYSPEPSYPMSGVPMSGQPMTGQPMMGPTSGPPGQQPPMGGYNPMFPQQPKKNNTPMIVGVVLGVVLLLGVGAVLFAVLGSGDDEPGDDIASQSPSVEPSVSESPSEDPADNRVGYQDFGVDWTGSYEGMDLSATFVEGWDYDDCSAVESGGALTSAGCEYAFEVIHEAEGGDLRIAQLVFAFPDEGSASSLESDIEIEEFEESYRFRSEGFITDYEEGLWWSEAAGRFAIVTIATRTDALDATTLENYLYGKSDDTMYTLSGL